MKKTSRSAVFLLTFLLALLTIIHPSNTMTAHAVSRIDVNFTFKVVHGSWSDGTKADKVVNLWRYDNEDKSLTLNPSDIPSVGDMPDTGYSAGSWDGLPNTERTYGNESQNFTYTYTYAGSGPAPTVYAVTASNDGHGSASATPTSGEEGTTVTITATPDSGYLFKNWDVVSGGVTLSDANSNTTTFDIGSSDVEVKANFEEIPVGTYSVTVNHGTGDGSYPEGATVTITADEPSSQKLFDKWTSEDGVTFADASATTTTFDMPAKAVTVTATYKNKQVVTRVNEDGLTAASLSAELRALGYTTVDKVLAALENALNVQTAEQKNNSFLFDAGLLISFDGGSNWVPVSTANIPAGGLKIVIPYPQAKDGTQTNGDDYTFSVAHLVGTTVGSVAAGTIETPDVTNTSDGIETTFNGLSPVLVTWTRNLAPSSGEVASGGAVTSSGTKETKVPVTAYYTFNSDVTQKIGSAAKGSTVKIETSSFISFHKSVMEALAKKTDVSMEISFLDGEYKGNRMIVTIPAGTDVMSLVDKNGFVGFLYLAGKFGYTTAH
ncbi:InlB B-repeat-containing protein [Butyrivibrio sp. AE2032]|uniref:InlB B-repeat-containing protein n=1 Tax=Butyrivibrio sp. AE2032 TaxID=1458463 RepID=UPI000558107B|nr:hypothetical protein [Butyrivibrio sp. AE2032]